MTAPTPPWTPEEEGLLRSLAAAGESAVAISTLLERPPRSAQAGSSAQHYVSPFAARAEDEMEMTGPDNKPPDSTSAIASAAPPAARELPKALRRQGLTASGRSLSAELAHRGQAELAAMARTGNCNTPARRVTSGTSHRFRFPVTIRPLPKGFGSGFVSMVPYLPGCMSDGETPQEALANVQDAILGWMEEAPRSRNCCANRLRPFHGH
jgi:antitoxin HicB